MQNGDGKGGGCDGRSAGLVGKCEGVNRTRAGLGCGPTCEFGGAFSSMLLLAREFKT